MGAVRVAVTVTGLLNMMFESGDESKPGTFLYLELLHQWLNGSMLAFRSGGRGSFPDRCRHMQFGFMLKMEVQCARKP